MDGDGTLVLLVNEYSLCFVCEMNYRTRWRLADSVGIPDSEDEDADGDGVPDNVQDSDGDGARSEWSSSNGFLFVYITGCFLRTSNRYS